MFKRLYQEVPYYDFTASDDVLNLSVTPLCHHVAALCIVSYGWPGGAMNPRPWQHQYHTLHIKQCTLHFPPWKLLCLFHEWLPPFHLSSHEEHAKWLIYDCGFLCLTSTPTDPPQRKPALPAAKKTWILEIFSMSRSDYTIPISYTKDLGFMPSLKHTQNALYEIWDIKDVHHLTRQRIIAFPMPS